MTHLTTPFQIFGEFMANVKVIIKSNIGPDNIS